MIARAFFVISLGVIAVFGVGRQAGAANEVTFGYTNDIVYEVYLYGIKSGKVRSDTVRVKPVATEIAALIGALGTRQFDLIEAAALIAAQVREKGVDGLIVGTGGRVLGGRHIMVNKQSGIQSVEMLKGKRLGVMSIPSTAVAHVRIVLSEKYGLTTSMTGGDVNWVELPLPTLPTALHRKQVDAAFLFHTPLLKSVKSGEFASIADTASDFRSLFRTDPLVSVIMTYQSKVDQKANDLRDAVKLLQQSAQWAKDNPKEVHSAVAKKAQELSADDIRRLAAEWYDVRFALEPADVEMLRAVWGMAAKMGVKTSNLKDMLWQ